MKMKIVTLCIGLLTIFYQGCGQDECQVLLNAPLSVISVAPSHGSIEISLQTDVVVAFSEAVTHESALDAISLQGNQAVIETQISFGAEDKVITMIPSQDLLPNTEYSIVIDPNLEGKISGELGVALEYTFTTIIQ